MTHYFLTWGVFRMSKTLTTMLQSLNLNGIADIYFDEEKKLKKTRELL